MNKGKVIGQTVIIYRFDKEKETVNSLYIHALPGDLLDRLKFCEIQYSLNQSEKSSIEELVSSGQVREACTSLENICKSLTPETTSADNKLLSKDKFTVKCYIITEADYQDVDCEEECAK